MCPSVEDYLLYRIHSLLKIGAIEEANICLAKLNKKQPSQRALITQAAVKMEDDLNTCKAILSECLHDDPETVCAYATIDFKEGKVEDALEKYTHVIDIIGFEPNIAYNMALCHYILKQYADASRVVEKIIVNSLNKFPEFDVRSRQLRGSYFRNSGTLQESYLIEAYNLKASIEYDRRNFIKAIETFDAIPQRNEEEVDPVTLHNQALFYLEKNEDDSLKKLTFLLSNPPFPPETFGNLLTLYCKHGYHNIAAEILSDNAHHKFELLDQNVCDYYEASIMATLSPDRALDKFDKLVKKCASSIRTLHKKKDGALRGNKVKEVQVLDCDIRCELDFCLAALMGQARVYWEREDFVSVEQLLQRYSDLCSNEDAWKTNMAHSLFAQQGEKLKESIKYYEPLVRKLGDASILNVSPIILANLCVAYIMNNQNEDAERIMKRTDKEESYNRVNHEKDASKKSHHGCIINLVIGTLYCERGSFKFGISRICKSLEPLESKLGPDTWYYAKRCLMALANRVAKHMIIPHSEMLNEIFDFLDDVVKFGKVMPSSLDQSTVKTKSGVDEPSSTIANEAMKLKRIFMKLKMAC